MLCHAVLCYASSCHAVPCHAVLCHATCNGRSGQNRTDLLDLLLVGAAVNSPGGSLVVKPIGNLVKPLFETVPVASQAPKHPIKVLAGRLHLHLPVVQITQARPEMNPTVMLSLQA